MNEIAGVMDGHTRKPFERGIGNVVIITHTDDGGVGMKAWEDGVGDRFSHWMRGRSCRRADVRGAGCVGRQMFHARYQVFRGPVHEFKFKASDNGDSVNHRKLQGKSKFVKVPCAMKNRHSKNTPADSLSGGCT